MKTSLSCQNSRLYGNVNQIELSPAKLKNCNENAFVWEKNLMKISWCLHILLLFSK